MQDKVNIDIIILSYAKTDALKQTTIESIKTLMASEDPQKISFNIIVIESNKNLKPYQYSNSSTIYPDVSFGYNRYMNIGLRQSSNPYVCLCNNDLIFHKGWVTEILKVFDANPEIESANPYSDLFDYDTRILVGQNVILRHDNLYLNGILTGWCIFVKRSVFEKIGLLDEQFTFWYADNDYDMTLRKHGVKHALIKSSLVTHLACQSHHTLLDRREELTTGQQVIFQAKWQKPSIIQRLKRLFS